MIGALEDAIEQDATISHADISEQISEKVEDPSKLKLKAKVGIYGYTNVMFIYSVLSFPISFKPENETVCDLIKGVNLGCVGSVIESVTVCVACISTETNFLLLWSCLQCEPDDLEEVFPPVIQSGGK